MSIGIYDHKLEKHVISGLIKYPDIYIEVSSFLNERDFSYDINQVVYKILSVAYNNKQEIDIVLISSRIKNLGISFKEEIDVDDYIEALSMVQSSKKSTIQAVKDLKAVSKRREFYQVCGNIQKNMLKGNNFSYEEVVQFVDKELYSKMNGYYHSNDCVDLFETMYDRVEDRGNNPQTKMGFDTPYSEWNKRIGGCLENNMYVFCSRPKQGKTTFLNDTAFQMANIIQKIPCLVLDTEMQGDEIGDRMLASLTGIPLYYIMTGLWRKNPEFTEKIRKAWKEIKENDYKLYHEYVVNVPVEQIINKIKKWYYTVVGRGNPCIIVYDYIKLTGESLSSHSKEHQIIGEKVNSLKALLGNEIRGTMLSACQINREGVSRGGVQNDDAGVIALSDRVLWFASYVGIFRRKTPDEISEETDKFGTHKLIDVESRYQGFNSHGHNDYVKNLDGDVINNFTNFSVNNFKVREVCNAEYMFSQLNGQAANPNNQNVTS